MGCSNYVSWWPCIEGEAISGDEFETLRTEFEAAVRDKQNRYRALGIRLKAAYRVVNASLDEDFEAKRAVLGRLGKSDSVSRLYHGTRAQSAKSIIKNGFRLPQHAGMFGKGIYFADTPLKSLQYTRSSFWGTRVILACDVVLGNTMVTHKPAKHLQAGSSGFERAWLLQLLGQKSFDSVTAASGWFSAVRVPEYVVYNTAQTVPRYVLIVEQH